MRILIRVLASYTFENSIEGMLIGFPIIFSLMGQIGDNL